MLKKILVCLDGSEFAEELLPYAIERARHFNSKITLLKVVTVNISAYAIGVPQQSALVISGVLQRDIRMEETRDRLYLDGLAKRLREMGLDVNWVAIHGIIRGSIASDIVTYAAENEVDLVMMATHRRSFWKRLVCGSVTDSVIRKSASPILVVSPQRDRTKESTFAEVP